MPETVSGLVLGDVIDDAIRRAGGQTATADDVVSARVSLKILLEKWNARGFRTWKIRTFTAKGKGPTIQLDEQIDDIFSVSVVSGDQGCNTVSESSLRRVTASEYADISSKGQAGQPAQYYLHRTEPPVLYLFPVGRSTLNNETFKIWAVERPPEWDLASNDMDVPGRWLAALITGLALDLAKKRNGPKGVIDMDRVNMLATDYADALEDASRADRERTNYRIRI